jgi:FAD/FMN-containing dehydrogenase
MSMTNQPLDPELLARFAAIVGERHALRETGDIASHLTEPRGLFGGATPLVLKPATTVEVAAILELATETGTAIVPQGGNTGLVGGQMPDAGGRQIIVSLSRMNAIREVDLSSDTITVEAGVTLQAVRDAAEGHRRLFPLSLGSQGSCQIGGNLSSNAGGTGALAYGTARDLCLGVEVAEGTLGIITAAVLKLYPAPRGREVAWVGLENPEAALELFRLATARAGASLTAFELCQDRPLDFVVAHIPGTRHPLEARHPWYVLMEVSSTRSEADARALVEDVLGTALEEGLVQDAAIAESIAQRTAFWHLREAMSEAQRPEGGSIKHDISVPVAAIPGFIEAAGLAVERVCPGARVVCFGHMGDGNLHYNVSQPVGWQKADFLALYPSMNEAVHALVREAQGSISAEHGIGTMKRDELERTAPAVGLDLMRRIKRAFDPAGIMNPGKVIRM